MPGLRGGRSVSKIKGINISIYQILSFVRLNMSISDNPQYIRSLYEAAKIYLQSRGIAWFNLEALARIVKFLTQTRTYVYSTQIDDAQVLKGLKFTKTGREAGYPLKFLWYIGFLSYKYETTNSTTNY